MKMINTTITIFAFFGFLVQCNERVAKPPGSDGEKTLDEDITFLREIATESTIQFVRFSIKDGKGLLRTDDPKFTELYDPEKGIYFLDHKTEKFWYHPFPEIPKRKPDHEATDNELRQYDLLEQSAKMVYSGKQKIIGKWQCREYILWDSYGTGVPPHLESSVIAWIADDFENGKALQKRIMDLTPLPFLSQLTKITGKSFQFPGFAIQIITRQANNLPATVTHREIIRQPLNKIDFEVPADYVPADKESTELLDE